MNIPQGPKSQVKLEDLCQPGDALHLRESRLLLAQIDALDRQIGAETTNKSNRRKLLQARSRIAQHFAKHLDAVEFSYNKKFDADDGRSVWVVLSITGAPSREGRQKAAQWMASRGIVWSGDVSSLRATMRQTLRRTDLNHNDLPDHHFGLRVERTVKIGVWSFDEAVNGHNEGRVTALPPSREDIVL
jgi:hypothetical protein